MQVVCRFHIHTHFAEKGYQYNPESSSSWIQEIITKRSLQMHNFKMLPWLWSYWHIFIEESKSTLGLGPHEYPIVNYFLVKRSTSWMVGHWIFYHVCTRIYTDWTRPQSRLSQKRFWCGVLCWLHAKHAKVIARSRIYWNVQIATDFLFVRVISIIN